jgi:regulator of telomere elongation helicase 1
LENPHIIENEQIHVRVVAKGVTGKLLNSSFERRKDAEYYIELGNTLVRLAEVVPAGMLVFFPSYGVMETCLERWGGPSSNRPRDGQTKNSFFAARQKQTKSTKFSFPCVPSSYFDKTSSSTPWKRLLATKAVVVEPKSTVNLSEAIAEFEKFLAVPKSSGCILMGVCRGKISEGIDFAHEQSRAVVITGLPFPPSFDPKVKMKRYVARVETLSQLIVRWTHNC